MTLVSGRLGRPIDRGEQRTLGAVQPPGADVVLAIDTATDYAAVGAARDGELLHEASLAPGPDGRPRHSAALLAEIEATADAAGGWERVGTLAVGVGPGTFTGLRVGIATVRALAQARRLPVAPVSSLAALALGIGATEAARGRRRLALIDAKREEVFAALQGAEGEPVWEPFVASVDELGRRLASEGATPVAAGDGSLRFRHQLEAAGVEVLAEADPAHRLAARHVCALARDVKPGRPEAVTPTYLRRPDAEVWRERRNRDI